MCGSVKGRASGTATEEEGGELILQIASEPLSYLATLPGAQQRAQADGLTGRSLALALRL
ncbi:hypothetical protein BV504_09210 [Halomonas sp. 'Soap Lake |nr:hypothetical protein B2G49_09215 [Halomonas sp. 'Soap Lake \